LKITCLKDIYSLTLFLIPDLKRKAITTRRGQPLRNFIFVHCNTYNPTNDKSKLYAIFIIDSDHLHLLPVNISLIFLLLELSYSKKYQPSRNVKEWNFFFEELRV
jgi:hypothetical protein